MIKELVKYSQAVELDKLGLDETCCTFYYDNGLLYDSEGFYRKGDNVLEGEYLAPTFGQAFRFLREKYDIHYSIDRECSQHDGKWGYNWSIYNYNKVIKTDEEYITSHPNAPAGEWVYSSYEDAEIEVLDKLIELTKNKENGKKD